MAKKKKSADTSSIAKNAQAQPAEGPMLQVLAQYTKDSSFENPHAPNSLRTGQAAPTIDLSIELGRQMFDDETVEVALSLRAEAKRDDSIAFIAELQYAGLFSFQNIKPEEALPLIMIECPRLLFPFARQILAEMTQSGGFPPLLLEPPDFAAMYRDEMNRRAADAAGAPN